MNQKINLYRGVVDIQPELSFRHILWIYFIAGMVLFVFQGILFILANANERKLGEVLQQQVTLKKEMDSKTSQDTIGQGSADLQAQVDLLTKNKQKKEKILTFLREKSLDTMDGFSEYLLGLSRSIIDGVWFTEIVFDQGGKEIELLGRAQEARLIPKLLESLNSEPTYDKKLFTQFEIVQDQTGESTITFDIKTAGVK